MGANGNATAAVLKILNGSARVNPGRLKNDAKVRPKGRPVLLDWVDLDAEERRVLDFYLECGILPSVHAKEDSSQLAAMARLTVQRDRAFALVKSEGQTVIHPISQKPMTAPWLPAWVTLNSQLMRMLNEMALSPAGRLRHAPPANGSGAGNEDPTSWDEIDG